MNHKLLTVVLITIGIGAFAFSFWLFQNLAFDNKSLTTSEMQEEVKKVAESQLSANTSKVLPDIKTTEPIANSKVRDLEIAKVKPSLPYYDPDYNYSIVLYEKTKTFTVEIPATSLDEYREKKQQAEVKLAELGSDNICNLVVFWAPPATLNQVLIKSDVTTSNCPS